MKNLQKTKFDRSHIDVHIKFTDKRGKVETYLRGTIKRFLSKLRGSSGRRIDIWVGYGKQKDVFGDTVMFTNEYSGTNQRDAIHAFEAFMEV